MRKFCRLPIDFNPLTANCTADEHSTAAKKYAAELAKFLSTPQYLSLATVHTYDMVVDDFFSNSLPAEWRSLADLDKFNQTDFVTLIKEGAIAKQWPDSFKTFAQDCLKLALPRAVDLSGDFGECLNGVDALIERKDTVSAGMSRKKLYEVERFSKVIIDMIENSDHQESTTIIDIGAGQGYLTHRLTTCRPCVAIDFDQIQTVGSKKRGADIKKGKFGDTRHSNFSNKKSAPRKEIIYKTLNVDAESLQNLVSDLSSSNSIDGSDTNFMLVGLHACGDLSSSAILGAFQKCPEVKFVAIVPCCYNLLTEPVQPLENPLSVPPKTTATTFGFPISTHVRELCATHHLTLGHKARNLACQNFETFSREDVVTNMRAHFKRSLFSALLSHFKIDTTIKTTGEHNEYCECTEEAQLCRVPKSERKYHKFRLNKVSAAARGGGFVEYAVEALKCIGLEDRISDKDIRDFLELPQFVNAERENFVMLCARSLLSRVLESFLLMDRAVFLLEMDELSRILGGASGINGIRFSMLNLFDLTESPRNMVFVAEKIASSDRKQQS
ncbi:hypothetical protein HK100_003522 [Physocladia obscura]|uniref:Methyltransferase domain-containing protein n=1 Tax=Physocladia obscura TaxID=109957 RepID=A0AAD5XFY6_9FUNG|nr:hypothetical protein HK100_003522 [Physocladia obscura]